MDAKTIKELVNAGLVKKLSNMGFTVLDISILLGLPEFTVRAYLHD